MSYEVEQSLDFAEWFIDYKNRSRELSYPFEPKKLTKGAVMYQIILGWFAIWSVTAMLILASYYFFYYAGMMNLAFVIAWVFLLSIPLVFFDACYQTWLFFHDSDRGVIRLLSVGKYFLRRKQTMRVPAEKILESQIVFENSDNYFVSWDAEGDCSKQLSSVSMLAKDICSWKKFEHVESWSTIVTFDKPPVDGYFEFTSYVGYLNRFHMKSGGVLRG